MTMKKQYILPKTEVCHIRATENLCNASDIFRGEYAGRDALVREEILWEEE